MNRLPDPASIDELRRIGPPAIDQLSEELTSDSAVHDLAMALYHVATAIHQDQPRFYPDCWSRAAKNALSTFRKTDAGRDADDRVALVTALGQFCTVPAALDQLVSLVEAAVSNDAEEIRDEGKVHMTAIRSLRDAAEYHDLGTDRSRVQNVLEEFEKASPFWPYAQVALAHTVGAAITPNSPIVQELKATNPLRRYHTAIALSRADKQDLAKFADAVAEVIKSARVANGRDDWIRTDLGDVPGWLKQATNLRAR